MDKNYLTETLGLLNQNGVTIFISGFLFTLFVYHALLYFQHRDKSYLYYSLYTFLVFIYVYHKAEYFFLSELTAGLRPYFKFFTNPLQWAFNTVYILFAKTFIDFKKHKPKWNKILNWVIFIQLVVLLLLLIHMLLTRQSNTVNFVYAYFYIPIVTVISVFFIVIIFSIDSFIKYYLLIGSITYLVLAVISYYSSQSSYGSTYLYYIALIVENIFFALGLGAKQKKVLLDKNTAQFEVIEEQLLNMKLQKEIKEKLDKEVALKTEKIFSLTKKHKEEEKQKLAIAYSKQTLELRMRTLQTQMNPHFLFNALNSIKHFIIKNKKEDATYFLSRLSSLIRKILENSLRREITLQEELNIMKLYMEVENIRLQKDIIFTIKVADMAALADVKIPPLVLQPFVENAIWHGLALKQGAKEIKISVEKTENTLIISIIDNGIGREQAAINKAARLVEKESLGINLTKERLEAYTAHLSEKVSITFKDIYHRDKPAGTIVLIRIPQ